MSVTFVLGRAGSGKTHTCLDAIRRELSEAEGDRRLLLLVPEQASFQMERELARRAPNHGYWRAEVLSFSRLARRVLDRAGRVPEMLNPGARAMALRIVVGRCEKALHVFGAAARAPGFIAQIEQLIGELLSERVSASSLAETAGRLADSRTAQRIAALAEIYAGYLEWVGSGRIDPGQRADVLCERLHAADWLRDASVWVDGFAGFTGQELETLVTLATVARDVTVTLLLDPNSPRLNAPTTALQPLELFARTEATYHALRKRLTDAGVAIREPVRLEPSPPPRFEMARGLALLEAGLAADGATPVRHDTHGDEQREVVVLACETHRAELRRAAHFIRQKVIESDGAVRYRDFAVITRELEPFARLVADVFGEFDIPVFLDRRRPLAPHALARFVTTLTDTVAHDLSVRTMTRLLRTGLLPLRREQAEQLENLIEEHELHGRDWWRRKRWPGRAAAEGASEGPYFKARSAIVEALEPLFELAQADPQPSGGAWARGAYQTLDRLRVRETLESWIGDAQASGRVESAETHAAIWEVLCQILDDVHDVLGKTELSFADFAGALRATLSEATIGLAPPTLDQVLVGSIERSRHPDVRYVWLFAFNEGVFPKPAAESTLPTTREREALSAAGLPAPKSRRDDAFAEKLLAYIACTRPSDGLVISYARTGGDGREMFASPLLADVCKALPQLVPADAQEDLAPVHAREFVRAFLTTKSEGGPRRRARYERLRSEIGSSSVCGGQVERLLAGTHYSNRPLAVPGYARDAELADDVLWFGSPSELETYVQCPFRHFARYGLRLSEQRGPTPLVTDLGRAAHEILAAVTQRAIAAPQTVQNIDDATWLAFLGEACEAYARSEADLVSERRPQTAFLTRVLFERMRDTVLAHAARYRAGAFEPVASERRFGRDAAGQEEVWAALELRTRSGKRVLLRGMIDRIDRCTAGGKETLLVYDYKTTTHPIKAEYLTQDRLQLFSYLLAVQQANAKKRGARVGGAFLAPLYLSSAALNSDYVRAADEIRQRMHMLRPRGLFDERLAERIDAGLGDNWSAVVMLRRKKQGGYWATSDVCSQGELERRLELARRTILQAAEGIAAGDVSVSPLVESRTLACHTCAYQALCRFEPVSNDARPAERVLPLLSDVPAAKVEAQHEFGGTE